MIVCGGSDSVEMVVVVGIANNNTTSENLMEYIIYNFCRLPK